MSHPGGGHEREKKTTDTKVMALVAHGVAACRCFSVTKRDDMKRMQMQTRYKKCYMLSIINSRREKKLSVFIFALTFDVVVTKLGSTASLRVHRTEKTRRLSGVVLY